MPAARRVIIFCVLLCASLPIPSAAKVQEQPFPKEYDFRYTTFEGIYNYDTHLKKKISLSIIKMIN